MASTYDWQQSDPTPLISTILSKKPDDTYGIATALTGNGNIGAQDIQQVNDYVTQKLLPAWQRQLQQETAKLTAINPAFDPSHYLADISQLISHGEGASANRSAGMENAAFQIQSQQYALQQAQAAAQKYQQTGVVEPYPDMATRIKNTYNKLTGYTMTQEGIDRGLNVLGGGKLPDAEMATANAAAARVGAALPYPNGPMGQIVPGGAITNDNVSQAYQGGRLSQVGQNIVQSNPQANMKNGTNQVTNNGDGSFTWNGQTYPNKDAVAMAANKAGVTSLRFSDGSTIGTPGASGTGAGSGAGSTGTPGSTIPGTPGAGGGVGTGGAIDPAAQKASMDILNKYLNDGTIDAGTYQMFKAAVASWEPGQQVDYANILNTFQNIKQSDIDPHFKEQTDLFINDLQNNRQYLQDTHALEMQTNQANADALKTNMQNDLASKGMLFTGQAVKTLGDQSAFATAGTPQANASAIPTIQPFAGQSTLQQQTQPAVSASDLRYQKSLKDLAASAESTLGTTASAGLVPGVTQVGGITGSLNEQKQQTEATALTGLYNQQQQNIAAQAPTKVFQE